jgi:hypothetical protein
MMRHFDRGFVAMVLVVILVGVVCFEVYAHLYIKIDNLPVVSSKYAFQVPQVINDSYTFSSGGTKWLLLWELLPASNDTVTPLGGTVNVYIFKLNESTNSIIQNLNIVGEKMLVTSSNGNFSASSGGLTNLRHNIFSEVGSVYSIGEVDGGPFPFEAYNKVDFAFTFQVYETTLVGIFPVQQEIIQFNDTMLLSSQ